MVPNKDCLYTLGGTSQRWSEDWEAQLECDDDDELTRYCSDLWAGVDMRRTQAGDWQLFESA